jgi:hypothetical protein
LGIILSLPIFPIQIAVFYTFYIYSKISPYLPFIGFIYSFSPDFLKWTYKLNFLLISGQTHNFLMFFTSGQNPESIPIRGNLPEWIIISEGNSRTAVSGNS